MPVPERSPLGRSTGPDHTGSPDEKSRPAKHASDPRETESATAGNQAGPPTDITGRKGKLTSDKRNFNQRSSQDREEPRDAAQGSHGSAWENVGKSRRKATEQDIQKDEGK
jgi:hypothetical protein